MSFSDVQFNNKTLEQAARNLAFCSTAYTIFRAMFNYFLDVLSYMRESIL